MRSILVFSIGCSGHHAVVNWICRQETPSMYFNNPVVKSDHLDITNYAVIYTEDGKIHKSRLHKQNSDMTMLHKVISGELEVTKVLYTIVNEDISQNLHVADFIDSDDITFVTILRDVYNTMASRTKKRLPIINRYYSAWIGCVKVALGDIPLPDGVRFVDISFNEWFKSKEYRIKLADRLNIPFTDEGLREIPFIGGGKFNDGDDGQKRDVLRRYVNQPGLLSEKRVKPYLIEEAMDLSDRYFGKIIDR